MPFLAPAGKELAFIQSSSPTFSQFEVWPALLMKGLAKLHGSYMKLKGLSFDEIAYSLLGSEGNLVTKMGPAELHAMVRKA